MFTKKKLKYQTRVKKHTAQSENALASFNQTLTDLSAANAEIEDDVETSKEIIKAMEEEIDTMSKIKENNSKIINKIEEFFKF